MHAFVHGRSAYTWMLHSCL